MIFCTTQKRFVCLPETVIGWIRQSCFIANRDQVQFRTRHATVDKIQQFFESTDHARVIKTNPGEISGNLSTVCVHGPKRQTNRPRLPGIVRVDQKKKLVRIDIPVRTRLDLIPVERHTCGCHSQLTCRVHGIIVQNFMALVNSCLPRCRQPRTEPIVVPRATAVSSHVLPSTM